MRTLVIGDIHGCYTALLAVVEAAGLSPDDRLVTVGDYVDRGPQTREVVAWLCERFPAGNLIPLKGNHELMMLAAREDPKAYKFWANYGGAEALQSYAASAESDEEPTLELVPEGHWHFLEHDCQQWFETESHIFVHASLHPDLPLERQYEHVLFWDRFLRPPPHCSGKIMVCGHTPQPDALPVNFGHAICLDTGAYVEGGWLTCLDVATGEYWQANQVGETRSAMLDEPTD